MEQKNLALTFALCLAILLGFQYFYERPRQLAAQAEAARQQAEQANLPQPQLDSQGTNAVGSPAPLRSRGEVLAEVARIPIKNSSLHGSINLRGARLDDLTLARYRVSVTQGSPEVTLLSPLGGPDAYVADFGWVAGSGAQDVILPKADSVWTASASMLEPGKPVTLSWENGQGLTFERVIELDQDYMFSITDRVRNASGRSVTLHPYGRVERRGTPAVDGGYALHEGPLGVIGGALQEFKYAKLAEQTGKPIEMKAAKGWIGITDKYWLVGLIPDAQAEHQFRVLHQKAGQDLYQTDFLSGPLTIADSATVETRHHLFTGAKVVDLLKDYERSLGVERLTYAIDWGWFYFLTIPFFYGLDALGKLFGNFGLAILAFTVLLRLAFFPIANKQFESFAKLKKLQPKMEELKRRHGDDREKLSMAMMQLYREEKANPMAGCLPILLQIPVFYALYKVLYVTIEMRHAPFYGWVHDLSAKDPTTLFNAFGLIPWDPPSILHIGVWPLLMGLTMWWQQKLNPSNPDPVQQKIFMALPILFTYMMAAFPAGLVIYWTWSNLLGIAQQQFIMRRMGVKAG
jgi:YidC/Oxa1 family membrane protein insertase